MSLLKSIHILILVVIAVAVQAQDDHIAWLKWEEAVKKVELVPRKIFVQVYTDWCGWCKKMDGSTFEDPDIIQYINDNFYAVKMDGEERSTITYRDKDYGYVSSGGRRYHELSYALLRGRLSYPTSVFLDEDLNVIQSLRGFQSADRLEQILVYFARDHYKTTPWVMYEKNYNRLIKSAADN